MVQKVCLRDELKSQVELKVNLKCKVKNLSQSSKVSCQTSELRATSKCRVNKSIEELK